MQIALQIDTPALRCTSNTLSLYLYEASIDSTATSKWKLSRSCDRNPLAAHSPSTSRRLKLHATNSNVLVSKLPLLLATATPHLLASRVFICMESASMWCFCIGKTTLTDPLPLLHRLTVTIARQVKCCFTACGVTAMRGAVETDAVIK